MKCRCRAQYQYSALQHPNVFGEYPRMLRGIVTKDRAPSSSLGSHAVGSRGRFRFFRPVVATFYAYGDSEDTHDTSYSEESRR